MIVDLVIPQRTTTGLNAREHRFERSQRVAIERGRTAVYLASVRLGLHLLRASTPLVVTLTRISPGHVPPDDDNVVGGLKGIRDEIAKWLGIDDRFHRLVRYRYQSAHGEWGVRVQICRGGEEFPLVEWPGHPKPEPERKGFGPIRRRA